MNDFFQHIIKLISGTKARAEDMNTRFDAIEAGFAKLPAAATLPGHACTASQAVAGGLMFANATGAANAFIVALAVAPAAYTAGLMISFKAGAANTGACTVNVNGLGIKNLYRSTGGACVSGDIALNQIVTAVYDGTAFKSTTTFQGQVAAAETACSGYATTATTQAGLSEGFAEDANDSAVAAAASASTAAGYVGALSVITAAGIDIITDATASEQRVTLGLGNVQNTTDAQKEVSTAQAAAIALKANITSPTFSGTVNGITKAMVGLGNVENYTPANMPVSTAQATAIALKANIASPTFSGTVAGITASMVGLGNVQNTADSAKEVSTLQEAAIALKADKSSPTFSGIPVAPTASSGTNTTQLATTQFVETATAPSQLLADIKTVDGTSSGLDADLLDGQHGSFYAPIASPTFTGTVGGVTKAMVGLNVVDNTSDANKPVSTEQASAIYTLKTGFKNKIINGGFSINQRLYSSGAAVGAALYGHDRWKMAASGDAYTFSTTNNKTLVTIPSGKVLKQIVEGLNLQTGTYCLSWEGTAQGKIGAGSFGASGVTGAITGGTDTTIEFGPGTVTNVQLEVSAVSTTFEQRFYGVELALCQRYYEKVSPEWVIGTGFEGLYPSAFSTNTANTVTNGCTPLSIRFSTEKRVIPTMIFYDSNGTPGYVAYILPGGTRVAGATPISSANSAGFCVGYSAPVTTSCGVTCLWQAIAEL
ncbi:MAG: hypothetical protein JZU65_16155 [Chlorobium sp.]|nr:hypothetical protein [Chlorobium sp.]